MNVNKKQSARLALLALPCLAWSLMVNGTIPYFGMPGLGQQASMLGYAQAFANDHWYSVYAHAFGYPTPTGLATGLPLAWVAGWCLRLGVAPADAYSWAAALWLALAWWGAMRITQRLGGSGALPSLAATAWLTLPMVWGHGGYTSLALGIALLPLYLDSALSVCAMSADARVSLRQRLGAAVGFVVLSIVALFMDGYSFMMFAMLMAIAVAFHSVEIENGRLHLRLLKSAVATWLAGFGVAVALYRAYTGHSGFDAPPLDFFRGWGLDLAFLFRPSAGDIWLGDILGFSVPRGASRYWGDFSVWTTTFALPLAIAGAACAVLTVRRDKRALMLICVALIGLYLALGPTLKLDAVKPVPDAQQMMAPQFGVASTGNGWLYSHVPGFRNMRATYRWEALFVLGMWALIAIAAGRSVRTSRYRWVALYLLLIVCSTPPLRETLRDYRNYREGLLEMERDLVAPLSRQVPAGSHVLFLPPGNDVTTVYVSPQLHIVSYNASGDKQIDVTRANWPEVLQRFRTDGVSADDQPIMREALLSDAVDVIVIPYFNNLWAAHMWPCLDSRLDWSPRTLAIRRDTPGFLCPDQMRAAYANTLASLRADPVLAVRETPLYALVTLRPPYNDKAYRASVESESLKGVHFPVDVVHDVQSANLLLRAGWAPPEPAQRWSTARASLILPVPATCRDKGCQAVFRFWAFAASPSRPVDVKCSIADPGSEQKAQQTTVSDQAIHELVMPIPPGQTTVKLRLDVPQAASPAALGMSADPRVLGISLQQITMMPR